MRIVRMLAVAAVTFSASAMPFHAQDASGSQLTGDAEIGEQVFRQCKSCHTIEKDGPNRVGPNLYGVIGSDVAAADGFRFSKALQDFGGVWSLERLDAFLANPRQAVPRTRMSFRGLPDAGDRSNVIAYLNANSDMPMEISVESAASDPATVDIDFGLLVMEDGVEETFYACTACHSEMIVVQQGKTRQGWDELFDWMVEEQGMSELSPEDRTVILDYLAEHYNTDRPNFPSR